MVHLSRKHSLIMENPMGWSTKMQVNYPRSELDLTDLWQKQNQEWVWRVSMGNSWHSESDIVTPRSRAEAVTHCFVLSSGDSKSWSRPQELGLDTINLVVNEIFADFLTPDRLLFLHDLLLAHCLELHICNQVFANILCCENGPTPLLNKSSVNNLAPNLREL